MTQIPIVPLAPAYGRSQRNIPLQPIGYPTSTPFAPTPPASGPTPVGTPIAQRDRANNIAQSKQYENDAFNKWYGGLHPDDAAKFAPATPPAGKLSTTDKTGKVLVNNSTPDEIAAGAHQQQLAAARAHFRANVLPNDAGYAAIQAKANPQQGLVPLDPRVQAAQITADARTKAAQITADQKPGFGERMLTGLGSGIKDIAKTVITQSGATARNDATNQTRTTIAGQNNATRTDIAGQNNQTKTDITDKNLAAKSAAAATKQPPLTLQEKADYATWNAQMRDAIANGKPPPPLPQNLHTRLSPAQAAPANPPPNTSGGVGSGGGAAPVNPTTSTQPATPAAPKVIQVNGQWMKADPVTNQLSPISDAEATRLSPLLNGKTPAAPIQGTGTPSGLPSNRPAGFSGTGVSSQAAANYGIDDGVSRPQDKTQAVNDYVNGVQSKNPVDDGVIRPTDARSGNPASKLAGMVPHDPSKQYTEGHTGADASGKPMIFTGGKWTYATGATK